jgi:hypothetical protein
MGNVSTSLPVLLYILRAGKVSPLVKSPLIKAPQNLHFIDIIVISLYDAPASRIPILHYKYRQSPR